MGMPEIFVKFKKQAQQMVNYRGTVCIIVKETETKYKEYKKIKDIKDTDFTSENMIYIRRTMSYGAGKLIVIGAKDIDSAIKVIHDKKFRFLAYATPSIENDEISKLVAFCKKREETSKKFGLIVGNEKADCKNIINWTSGGMVDKNDKTWTAQEYTCVIAGILAGLPVNQSATYFVLNDLKSCPIIEDMDTHVDAGEFFCFDDGEKIKLSRAVNSLTTLAQDDSEELKKIKIVDGMNILEDTIVTNFEDFYVGKVENNYSNKMLYYSAVTNKLLKDLAKRGILNRDVENICEMDYEAQKQYLEDSGIDTDEMEEVKIRKADTGTKVFASVRVRFIDCMEDLYVNVNM